MKRTFKIGNRDIRRIGFGTMRSTTGTGIWGDTDDKYQAIKVIRKAVEEGVNFIDTADSYGPYTSELLLAEALAPFNEEVAVATKGGAVKYKPGAVMSNGHPYYLRTAIEGSLKRLSRDSIDFYFLHRVDPNIPIEESVGALADFQAEGKIKHIGVSNVNVDQLRKAQSVAKIEAVQNAFNYQDRRHEEVVNITANENIMFVAHTPVAVNNWSSGILNNAADYNISANQASLAWLHQFADNIVSIPGTSSVNHLMENLAANQISFKIQ